MKTPYVLLEKDIMKLGRVKYLVKEIGSLHNKGEDQPNCEQGYSANSIFTETTEEFEQIKNVEAIDDP